MKRIEHGLDLTAIRKALDEEEWEDGPECGTDYEERQIYLGSVFSLTPSGKYYAPFASGNLKGCPCCGGTGVRKPLIKSRVVKKRAGRRKRAILQGMKNDWTPRWSAKRDRASKLNDTGTTQCSRCEGCGSAEARDDEVWNVEVQKVFDEQGWFLTTNEGDSTQLMVGEVRAKEEDE